MTFSVDRFLGRRYQRQTYDCLHFVRDVWLELTGEDLVERLAAAAGPAGARSIGLDDVRGFRRLAAPEDPCLVLMRRRRSAPHAGVYLRGRVLHLHERGVEFMPPDVAGRGFSTMGYYA